MSLWRPPRYANAKCHSSNRYTFAYLFGVISIFAEQSAISNHPFHSDSFRLERVVFPFYTPLYKMKDPISAGDFTWLQNKEHNSGRIPL